MTPTEVAALAACWACVANRQAALLFLLARIAGMTPEQVAAGSSCWACVPNFAAAELFLLNTIVTNGTGGGSSGGTVTSGVGPPGAVPASGIGWYIDTANGATYYVASGAWVLKA